MFTRIKRLSLNIWLWTALFSLLTFTKALAASGDLDTTFSGDGRVTSYVVPANPGRYDFVRAIAIQPNGKIVAAGYSFVPSTAITDFAISRYNPNGSLDTTFSGDGRLITNFGGEDAAFAVAVQPDGKIVAAGHKCISDACDVALARYTAGGVLDTTFSGDGKQTTDYQDNDNTAFGGLAIQPDGKIVVAGYVWTGTSLDFGIYRYNSNGTPDTTFSADGDGVAVGGFGSGRQDGARDLVIQGDGKIVVAGFTLGGSYATNNFAMVRLLPNGTLDTAFGANGKVTTNFGGDDDAQGVALQPDGKIVVVGEKETSTGSYFAIARYNPNGRLDTTFNGTGKKAFSIISGLDSFAYDVLVQSNGKIVVVGSMESEDFALVRLNPNGSFDTNFSGDGKVTVDFSGGSDYAYALARQPLNGRYVLGGSTNLTGGIDFALARVLP